MEPHPAIQVEFSGSSVSDAVTGHLPAEPDDVAPEHRWLDDIAGVLERSGDFRILRRLTPRAQFDDLAGEPSLRQAVLVDVETTGLDVGNDEIIELAMLTVEFAPDGRIGRIVDSFDSLNQPAAELKPEITRLTGITAEMLEGRRIQPDEIAKFLDSAAIVCAHNAKFDRRMLERKFPVFEHFPFACSATQLDWRSLGFGSARLSSLLADLGYFHVAHRALDDCYGLAAILASQLPGHCETLFGKLLAAARKNTRRIWAEHAPYQFKEILKRRPNRYRWPDGSDGRPRSWFVDVDESEAAAEVRFLIDEIYQRDVDLRIQEITAFDRFSNRE
jgi:DNA polymerase-3 subunit epsilon